MHRRHTISPEEIRLLKITQFRYVITSSHGQGANKELYLVVKNNKVSYFVWCHGNVAGPMDDLAVAAELYNSV